MPCPRNVTVLSSSRTSTNREVADICFKPIADDGLLPRLVNYTFDVGVLYLGTCVLDPRGAQSPELPPVLDVGANDQGRPCNIGV